MRKLLASLSILALMASPALADDPFARLGESGDYVMPQDVYHKWDKAQEKSEPVVAVIQNNDQSSMHVLELHNFGACRNLATSILRDKTEDQKRVDEELKHTDSAGGRGFNNNSPDEVICISSDGHETLFTPNILAEGIVP